MTDAEPQKLSLLAKLVVAFILVLIVAGVVWHGVSIATFERIWHDLVAREDAPMRFRFILQPLMAAIAAILGGLKDARTGRSPYFWTMLGNLGQPSRARRTAGGGVERDRQDHPSRPRDGCDLPDHRAEAVLSGRGGYCRFAVRVCPVCDHPRAGRAHRAPVARRCLQIGSREGADMNRRQKDIKHGRFTHRRKHGQVRGTGNG